MKVIAATLLHATPDLAVAMRNQLPDVLLLDNGSAPPIPGADIRMPENLGFVRGWNDYMSRTDADYCWMLNSDLQGVNEDMLRELVEVADARKLFAVSPAFNSPHSLFWPDPQYLTAPRVSRWLDWCCPLVAVSIWRQLGGFDTRSTGYYADMDICHRSFLRGYRVAICDWLQVHHIGSVTADLVGHSWSTDETWIKEKWKLGDVQDIAPFTREREREVFAEAPSQ